MRGAIRNDHAVAKTKRTSVISDQYDPEVCLGHLKKYTFKELRASTNNFNSKNILGEGGYGIVYKGFLRDGSIVDVKRLKYYNAVGGEVQFQTEVEVISLAVHRNFLRLIGFCTTECERLLVYPYMPNGSVASQLREHINGKPALDWSRRKMIALGTARGLLYLHEQCDPKIIHHDVKTSNVLLDEYFEAIFRDFGLAKLLDHQETHVTTAVRGTVGHIAPEYLSTGQSSEKTDVFGFGVLLVELITGQKALDFGRLANQKGGVLDLVKELHQEKQLNMMVDKDLGSNYDRVELGEMVQVALLCMQYYPSHRPRMSEVIRMMEGDGLAEKWEASQNVDTPKSVSSELLPLKFTDFAGADESSVGLEAMELSGPSTTRQGKQQTSAMHGKQQSSPWGWLRGLDGLFGAQPAKDQDNRENGLGVLFASSSSKSFMARCVCSDGGEQQQGGNTGGGATAISSRSPRSRASAYTAAHSRPPCRDQHTHSYERREIGQGLTYLCERAPSRREGETDLGAPVKVRNGR
ncbi:hypothetical protein ZWY2020_022353 [Hordeum vulgare]|nr:hypothetical protein ZWY2020_022353 [Hordeum vulgare]